MGLCNLKCSSFNNSRNHTILETLWSYTRLLHYTEKSFLVSSTSNKSLHPQLYAITCYRFSRDRTRSQITITISKQGPKVIVFWEEQTHPRIIFEIPNYSHGHTHMENFRIMCKLTQEMYRVGNVCSSHRKIEKMNHNMSINREDEPLISLWNILVWSCSCLFISSYSLSNRYKDNGEQ